MQLLVLSTNAPKLEPTFLCLSDHSSFQKFLISEGLQHFWIMKKSNAMITEKKLFSWAKGTWLRTLECHAQKNSPCWTQMTSQDGDPLCISTLRTSFSPCFTKNLCRVLIPSLFEFYCPQHSLHFLSRKKSWPILYLHVLKNVMQIKLHHVHYMEKHQ